MGTVVRMLSSQDLLQLGLCPSPPPRPAPPHRRSESTELSKCELYKSAPLTAILRSSC